MTLLRPLALFLCSFAALAIHAQEPAARLVLTSSAAGTGGETVIDVHLEDSDNRIAALTFVLTFDETKLALDSPRPRSSVSLDLPSGFTGRVFAFPEDGRLGISVYDPDAPVSVLGDGLIARVRFTAVPGAEGSTTLGIESSMSAADPEARTVPLVGPVEPLAVTLSFDGGSSMSSSRRPSQPDASRTRARRTVHRQGWKRVLPVTSTPDGELWRVSLALTNRSKNPGRVNISLAGQSAEIALLPGERRTIDDALALFPLSGDAAGAVVIETGAAGIELEARTHGRNGGERSQSLPLTGWDALLSGSNKRTINLRDLLATEDIRVIISNLGEKSTTVTAHVRDARGEVIAREILPLAAGSSGPIDLTWIIRSYGGAASLVELTSETPESRVFGYLTTTDRGTRAPLVRIAQ